MNIQRAFFAAFCISMGIAALPSCFVFKTNVDWSHSSRANSSQDSVARPQIEVSLGQKPHFLLLPFLMILYDTKGYATGFNFASQKDFGKIDSINIALYSKRSSLIYTDKSTPNVYYSSHKSTKYEKSLDTRIEGMYWGSFEVKMPGALINKKDEEVIMNYNIFTRNPSGKVTIYRCDSCKLKREGKRFGSFL